MSKIGNFLAEMKTKLEAIPNIKTLQIGLERGIGSKDATFIRIIPEQNEKDKEGKGSRCNADGAGGHDTMTVQVLFGFDLKNQELEELMFQYYDLEEEIRAALLTRYETNGHMKFLHTATDEDRIPNMKAAISRYKIVGIR